MDSDLIGKILEPWHINHRVNEMLLDAITPEGLACSLSKRGGRDVGRQFAHLHDVRLMWMEVSAKPFMKGMAKIDSKGEIDRALLKRRLKESSDAVAKWLSEALAGDGSIKSFKRSAHTLLAYLLAHEGHHRGSILLTLKECGHKVPQSVQFGIWEWGKI